MDTPYQWTKQVASHWGGTRNGTIVQWPRGFSARGEVRNQFHHVIDVAPTVLGAAGLPEPTSVHGVEQRPMEGVSMAYSFDEANAAERHGTQYSDASVPAGTHQVRMEFAYDGGGLAKGDTVTLYIDGSQVGQGRVEATMPTAFSADETCDIGSDTASPVSDDYTREHSAVSGTVNWVQIDIDEAAEDVDHLITPEERLAVAMARR